MRLVPRSLSARLLAVSVLTTAVALALAAFAIGQVLERFVIRGLDQQLDAQLTTLARAVRGDGTLDRSKVVELPAFERVGQGWGWRVESARGRWTGGDPVRVSRPFDALPNVRHGLGHDGSGAIPGEGRTEAGDRVHTRTLLVRTSRDDVTILAAGPRRLAVAPLREAMVPLLGSLAILGLVLSIATLVQLRYGMRPLRDLQAAVAEVRSGRARHVPTRQPRELAPLAAELNLLVDRNEAQLAHARRHVANLAHGLKTPLATLGLKLAEQGAAPELLAMAAAIDGRIRHHLGRARAAAPGSRNQARTELAPAIDALVAVMNALHADRPIVATRDVAAGLAIVADAQDVDEMLGNLLDNAWRHARSAVSIAAAPFGGQARLVIEDDGPGLTSPAIAAALVPGRRLDERGDGHGFGLPIVQELAELNGGELTLGEATLGGLAAILTLPAAVAGS